MSPFDIDVFFRIEAFLRYGTFFVPDVFVLLDNAGMGFSLLFLLNCTFAASVISCFNRNRDVLCRIKLLIIDIDCKALILSIDDNVGYHTQMKK